MTPRAALPLLPTDLLLARLALVEAVCVAAAALQGGVSAQYYQYDPRGQVHSVLGGSGATNYQQSRAADVYGNYHEGPSPGGMRPTPFAGNGLYQDPGTGLQSPASAGMRGHYDSGSGQEVDDFPVDERGRALPYAPVLKGINRGAGHGIEALNFASKFNAICNAFTFLTGKEAKSKAGECVGPFDRILAGLGSIPSGGASLVGSLDDWGRAGWNGFQKLLRGKFPKKEGAAESIRYAAGAWRVYKQSRYGDEILVIGRRPDVADFARTPEYAKGGYKFLDEQKWSPMANEAWVHGGIERGATFRLVSPTTIRNLRNIDNPDRLAVYFHELKQLKRAGYRRSGDLMLPPSP